MSDTTAEGHPAATDRPPIAAPHRLRLLAWLLLYAIGVVYSSLVLGPVGFHYRPRDPVAAWRAFLHTPYVENGSDQRPDWIANLLYLIPLGFLLAAVLWPYRWRWGRPFAVLAALALGIIFVLAVKYTQLFFPPRTVTLNYITAQSIGVTLGVGLLCWWRGRLAPFVARQFAGGNGLAIVLGAYTIALIGYALVPFDVALSAADWQARLAELPSLLISLPGAGRPRGIRIILVVMSTASTIPLGMLLALLAPRASLLRHAVVGLLLMIAVTLAEFRRAQRHAHPARDRLPHARHHPGRAAAARPPRARPGAAARFARAAGARAGAALHRRRSLRQRPADAKLAHCPPGDGRPRMARPAPVLALVHRHQGARRAEPGRAPRDVRSDRRDDLAPPRPHARRSLARGRPRHPLLPGHRGRALVQARTPARLQRGAGRRRGRRRCVPGDAPRLAPVRGSDLASACLRRRSGAGPAPGHCHRRLHRRRLRRAHGGGGGALPAGPVMAGRRPPRLCGGAVALAGGMADRRSLRPALPRFFPLDRLAARRRNRTSWCW